MSKEMILIASDNHGIFIPQLIAKGELDNPKWNWDGVTEHSKQALLNGPDDESYWDAWDEAERNVRITVQTTGIVYYLHQDGDLWAVPEGQDFPEY